MNREPWNDADTVHGPRSTVHDLSSAIPMLQGVEAASPATTLWLPGDLAAPRACLFGEPLLQRARGQMQLASLLADVAQESKNALPDDRIMAAQRLFFDLPGTRTTS